MTKIDVYLEDGAKRTFASAVDWPGWSRGARGEESALEALAAYGPRYGKVVKRAVPSFAPPKDASSFKLVMRVKGGAGTDFGVPSVGLATDAKAVSEAELKRLAAILTACWAAFDKAALAAVGVELRKGPRGGGRELEKIVAHVIEADEAYLVQLGSKRPKVVNDDEKRRAMRLRGAMLETLTRRARGQPLAEPNKVSKPWTPRYFARRTAWHVLDHAWEIEDRAK